ncbi:uncharacterized protein VDAG_09214 [Verticillium dahliae VdLs.17]|uniref:J domain-containing protein n=1 Tax=Verticillium dahliae (strain VdLs.17 / ATCC MYA-4575 / FGSC 10137) TaxID=498257 RepID=G2XFU0_VERDV|nr:uncharacterized protein VDAG_09214 [Verticillium dahliae VdLs.17]EGY18688.1 hypothetical protein VDAG_09214 [Verticillium dahliae VdLs.17]
MASKNTDNKRKNMSDDRKVVYPDLTGFKTLIQSRADGSSYSPRGHGASELAVAANYHPPNAMSESGSDRAAVTNYHPPNAKSESGSDMGPESPAMGSPDPRPLKEKKKEIKDYLWKLPESPVEETPDPRLSEEKRQAINGFLWNLNENPSHYSILGLPDYADATKLAKALRSQHLKFHPDKNGFPGAKKCYNRVVESYKVLDDSKKKARYDKILQEIAKSDYQGAPNMSKKPHFEEAFHQSAWGREDEDDVGLNKHKDETDSESEAEELSKEATFPHVPSPDTTITDILDQMNSDVLTWFTSSNVDDWKQADFRIKNANKSIEQINKASRMPKSMYTFKGNDLASVLSDFRNMKRSLREKKTAHVAEGLGHAILLNFDAVRKRPENQWPVKWTELIREAVASVHAKKGYPYNGPRQIALKPQAKSGFPGLRESKPDFIPVEPEDTLMPDAPAASSQNYTQQVGFSGFSLSESYPKPGYTLDNRRILGFRGWEAADVREVALDSKPFDLSSARFARMQFIVEGFNGKSIELLSGTEAGQLVKKAHFSQHLSQQGFVPSSMKQVQGSIQRPKSILKYACYDATSTTIPDGVALVEAERGPPFLISLVVMRAICNKERVDAALRRYLETHRRLPSLSHSENRRLTYRPRQPEALRRIGYRNHIDDFIADDPGLLTNSDVSSSDDGAFSSDDEGMGWLVHRPNRGREARRTGGSDDRKIHGLIGSMGRHLKI